MSQNLSRMGNVAIEKQRSITSETTANVITLKEKDFECYQFKVVIVGII